MNKHFNERYTAAPVYSGHHLHFGPHKIYYRIGTVYHLDLRSGFFCDMMETTENHIPHNRARRAG